MNAPDAKHMPVSGVFASGGRLAQPDRTGTDWKVGAMRNSFPR